MNNEIKVYGEAFLAVAPNEASISLGVVTENASLSVAQAENATTMANVIQAIKALGVPENNIQTTRYTIFPQYDFVDGVQQFRNFRVEHVINVTVNNLEAIGTIIDTSVNNGANIINDIRFTVTNTSDIYNDLLTMALQNADEKAQTIAQTIGVTTPIFPVTITEMTNRTQSSNPELFMAKQATTIQPGEVTLEATVLVTYMYNL